jgi:competence protein ComEC
VIPERVTFLDVGQGHAALVVSGGLALLVDCPTGQQTVVQTRLELEGARLEDIFVTHRDLDHCGGVPALLEICGARKIYLNFGWALPPGTRDKVKVKAVLSSIFSTVERDGLELLNAYAGDSGTLGKVRWQMVAPNTVDVGRSALNDNSNRSSMVMRVQAAGTTVLLTGDADDFAIQSLIDSGADLTADVLLVPHHGSKTRRLKELLSATGSSVAVVSAGRVNAFGHPHSDTLLELALRDGIYVACTQVSRSCHQGDLVDRACAGSVTVQLGTSPLILDQAAHRERIDGLAWPICEKKSLNE